MYFYSIVGNSNEGYMYNYGEELEAKYGTVAIAYMNGFAQGAGFHPDFQDSRWIVMRHLMMLILVSWSPLLGLLNCF